MVLQRHEARLGAHLLGVDHVAREGRPTADDLVTRVEQRLCEAVHHAVRARAGSDLLEAHPVPLGECPAETEGAAVRIAVQFPCRALDRLEGGRQRPPRALVRRELDDALQAELALELLDRLAWLVRHELA